MSRLKSAAGPAGAPSPSRLDDLGRVGRSAVSVARACRIALSIVDTPCENLYHAPEINKRSLCEGWARGRVFAGVRQRVNAAVGALDATTALTLGRCWRGCRVIASDPLAVRFAPPVPDRSPRQPAGPGLFPDCGSLFPG